MSEQNPRIRNYMTKAPISISSEASILEVMEIMQEKNIRHLPVKKEKKTIGMISDRGIKSLFALAGRALADIINEKNLSHPDLKFY